MKQTTKIDTLIYWTVGLLACHWFPYINSIYILTRLTPWLEGEDGCSVFLNLYYKPERIWSRSN